MKKIALVAAVAALVLAACSKQEQKAEQAPAAQTEQVAKEAEAAAQQVAPAQEGATTEPAPATDGAAAQPEQPAQTTDTAEAKAPEDQQY